MSSEITFLQDQNGPYQNSNEKLLNSPPENHEDQQIGLKQANLNCAISELTVNNDKDLMSNLGIQSADQNIRVPNADTMLNNSFDNRQ